MGLRVMPNALRVYTTLTGAGVQDDKALAVAALVASSKTPAAVYRESDAIDLLFDAGFEEALAEAVAKSIANCFPSQKFSRTYNRTRLKTALVRGQWPAAIAETFLTSLEPCVVTPTKHEVRAPVRYVPGAGKVVMCDFSFLRRPEMQKERRAIVVSTRAASGNGRCIVVPVSKTESVEPNSHHYRFDPGAYPFFHRTEPVWAVCEHLYTVSLDRLWQINIRDRAALPSISQEDLDGVRKLAGTSLGL